MCFRLNIRQLTLTVGHMTIYIINTQYLGTFGFSTIANSGSYTFGHMFYSTPSYACLL
jgi:hypothetical protein